MEITFAVVKEQGVQFAVVLVKGHVTQNRAEAGTMMAQLQGSFPGMPVVLASQDSSGRPTYFGRRDIATFLSRVPFAAIPWRKGSLH